MSREIKYRVYDKKEKCYSDKAFSIDQLGICYVHEDGYWEEIDEERYIVEQYTGLKDKNRKEIYVGDIVSEHNGDIIGEIIQKPSGEYCIAWIGIYGGSSVLYDELSMCEVIGNIHENPELLGGGE